MEADHASLFNVLSQEISMMTINQMFDMMHSVMVEEPEPSHPVVGMILDTCNLHSPTAYWDAPTFPPAQYDPLCGLWYYGERYLTKRWVQGIIIGFICLLVAYPTLMYFSAQYAFYIMKVVFYTGTDDYARYNI